MDILIRHRELDNEHYSVRWQLDIGEEGEMVVTCPRCGSHCYEHPQAEILSCQDCGHKEIIP